MEPSETVALTPESTALDAPASASVPSETVAPTPVRVILSSVVAKAENGAVEKGAELNI